MTKQCAPTNPMSSNLWQVTPTWPALVGQGRQGGVRAFWSPPLTLCLQPALPAGQTPNSRLRVLLREVCVPPISTHLDPHDIRGIFRRDKGNPGSPH